LFLFGGLVLIIGSVVCINGWNSDYASAVCERAKRDEPKFIEARQRCGSPDTDCYKQATRGLTFPEDCEARLEYVNNQIMLGGFAAFIGGALAIVGFFIIISGFVLGGRKKAAAST
jgi:hypothetical protein